MLLLGDRLQVKSTPLLRSRTQSKESFDAKSLRMCENKEACGVVEYAMVRPASLWGTLSGILDVSAKMGILLNE